MFLNTGGDRARRNFEDRNDDGGDRPPRDRNGEGGEGECEFKKTHNQVHL